MVNEDQEMLKEFMSCRLVGMRVVEDLREWKCVHDVYLHDLCDDCARMLSFRDGIEGK